MKVRGKSTGLQQHLQQHPAVPGCAADGEQRPALTSNTGINGHHYPRHPGSQSNAGSRYLDQTQTARKYARRHASANKGITILYSSPHNCIRQRGSSKRITGHLRREAVTAAAQQIAADNSTAVRNKYPSEAGKNRQLQFSIFYDSLFIQRLLFIA